MAFYTSLLSHNGMLYHLIYFHLRLLTPIFGVWGKNVGSFLWRVLPGCYENGTLMWSYQMTKMCVQERHKTFFSLINISLL
jgi:hypothetical protein